MKPDQDTADPEAGPESDPVIAVVKSSDEPTVKPAEVNKDELIPLTHAPTQTADEKQPRLIHPFLLKIPMQVRYAVYGALSSALFMVLYNTAVGRLGHLYVPSTIYAVTYLIFIPIQHAMASCMVFGWPHRYFPSLTSNVPIGLTAIALGSYLTAYLDQVDFDQSVETILRNTGLAKSASENKQKEESGEFYTSFFVLVVTSLWSFLLSVLVNAPAETPGKKEL